METLTNNADDTTLGSYDIDTGSDGFMDLDDDGWRSSPVAAAACLAQDDMTLEKDEQVFVDIDGMDVSSQEEEGDHDSDVDTRGEAIDRVEDLVLSFLSQLSTAIARGDDENITKQRKGSSRKKIELQLVDRKKTMDDGSYAPRSITFPQACRASSKTLAQVLRVADLTHEALVEDVPTTKRDMYYKDVPLFKSQAVVNRLVDDMAATFALGRADMNVRAASKGLFAGESLIIHLKDDGEIRGNDSEGMLVPTADEISRFEVKEDVGWVLVIEKEAVFQTLCRYKFTSHASLPSKGIIITGKGYPDVATRQLVKTLADNLPTSVPLVALVDGDAYGIDILSVYKYGSASMRHESGKLAASRIRWLGIKSSELHGLGIDRDALIAITSHDEKKTLSLLQRPEDVMPRKWRRELLHMLHLRRKAEIEILSTVQSVSKTPVPPLIAYLASKISGIVSFP